MLPDYTIPWLSVYTPIKDNLTVFITGNSSVSTDRYNRFKMEPLLRIELRAADYKTAVLPLNYRGKFNRICWFLRALPTELQDLSILTGLEPATTTLSEYEVLLLYIS